MAIINYTDQIKYAGRGYLDAKMMPVNTFEDLKKISMTQRFEGLTVTVLNDGNPQDYWLIGGTTNTCWIPKTTNFEDLKLVLEEGFLKLMKGENQLGEPVDFNNFFPSSDLGSDLYIDTVDYSTVDAEGNTCIFMCFTYSDATKKYLDMSNFLSMSYEAGNGIVINGNVISIDEAITGKIEILETAISELNETVSQKADVSSVQEMIAEEKTNRENDINLINTKIGNLPEDETIVGLIRQEAIERSENINILEGAVNEELSKKADIEHTHDEFENLQNEINEEKTTRETALNSINERLSNLLSQVDTNKQNIEINKVDIATLTERVNALSSAAEGSTPDGKTIGITEDEQKALYVKVLEKEGNILKVDSNNGETGLFASIPVFFEDEELN